MSLVFPDVYNRLGDIGHENFANYLKFVLQKNIMVLIHILSAIEVFPRTLPRKKFDRPTLVSPHLAP